MYKVILFDLDGTLTDPHEGIVNSIKYALEKMEIVELDSTKLLSFIGPPLQESFSEMYDLDEKEVERAIEYYREYFKEKGMFENEVYPHIVQLLEELCNGGMTLVVATSKPTIFAKEILKYFQLDTYFDCIVGSNLDGTRRDKSEIIAHILNEYSTYRKSEFMMIGDRKHDIIGATNCGIHSVGVKWGYGSSEELLEGAEPTYLVEYVMEIATVTSETGIACVD